MVNTAYESADQLGRTNGACVVSQFVPDLPWLSNRHVRDWLALGNFPGVWQQDAVRAAFPVDDHSRLEQLQADSEHYISILESLPRVFSHFDFKRSNIFLRQRSDGERELVLVDWADCGIQTLGGDLVFLVTGSTWFFDWDVSQVHELGDKALTAYIHGLQAAGWRGDEHQVRLAYWLWTALYFGLFLPGAMAWVQDPLNQDDASRMFYHVIDAIPSAWRKLSSFALDC